MLESFLIGLITSGIYHLAQRHREHVKVEELRDSLSKQAIQASLENGLKSVFPKISKNFAEIESVDLEQAQCLKELFSRSDLELSDMLRRTIEECLYGLAASEYGTGQKDVDMFSVEGFEKALEGLRTRKDLPSLTRESLLVAVPGIFTQMLGEIATNPALSCVFDLIREVQKARFREVVIDRLGKIQENLRLDDETVLEVVNIARHKVKAQATRAYDIKMAGREPHIKDRFVYMLPRMRIVVKDGNIVPEEFESRAEPIDPEAFQQLVLDKRRVMVIGDAGVGKTTFLHRLQLEMLRRKLNETPLPIFENVSDFFRNSGTLFDRVSRLLQNTKGAGFSMEKANKIAGLLNESGRLCFLLDSLDQCADYQSYKNHFQMGLSRILEKNRVVVTCRTEHVKTAPEIFLDIFSSYEWVIIDGFDKDQLLTYLGPAIRLWLDYHELHENLKNLLTIPFYANATRRIGLRPDSKRIRVNNQGRLLQEYEKELFREANLRGIIIRPLYESKIKKILYRLALDTLVENHIQKFPSHFLDKYYNEDPAACEIIFDTQWVFFNRTLFESKDENQCTFYHQLMHEFFAACRLKQLFEEDHEAFSRAIEKLPFSPVMLNLIDDIFPNEPLFNYCMEQFYIYLAKADREKDGLSGHGNRFTWLLAFRDRKGEKAEIKQRLQDIFDKERESSWRETATAGKFVRIPAGAFLMGSYEKYRERPVRVIFLSEFWISKYLETFREYDEYCKACGKQKPDDEGWRGDRPVSKVSWDDIKKYIHWRNKAYNLPSEAQWEKAARGRLGRRYPWGNGDPDKTLAYFDDYSVALLKTKVNEFDPQMYGIHQMAGNVWEWVEDDWRDSYSGGPDDDSAWIDRPERSIDGVARGGSRSEYARYCRSVSRESFMRYLRSRNIGFRLVK